MAAALSARIEPGTLLSSKYEIVRLLGEGGVGTVYEARHTGTHGRVAVKVLRPENRLDSAVVARFALEARAAGALRSPHIARVLDVDETLEGIPYLVLELLEGRDLSTELKSRGRLPLEEAAVYILEACAGLAEAHANGYVHRDLKPSNLFVAERHGERHVKILDFGIAKKLDAADDELTRSLSVLGTPSYMSPEQVRDARRVDERTDIWSLGVVLYRLVTAELPFQGTQGNVFVAIATEPARQPRELVPSLPEELDALVARALEKDPARRFPDIGSFARTLAAFVPGDVADRLLPSIERFSPERPEQEEPAPSSSGAPVTPDPGSFRSICIDVTQNEADRAVEAWAAPPPRRRRLVVLGLAAATTVATVAALLARRPDGPAPAASAAPVACVALTTSAAPAGPSPPPTSEAEPAIAAAPPTTALPPAHAPSPRARGGTSTNPAPRPRQSGAALPGHLPDRL